MKTRRKEVTQDWMRICQRDASANVVQLVGPFAAPARARAVVKERCACMHRECTQERRHTSTFTLNTHLHAHTGTYTHKHRHRHMHTTAEGADLGRRSRLGDDRLRFRPWRFPERSAAYATRCTLTRTYVSTHSSVCRSRPTRATR